MELVDKGVNMLQWFQNLRGDQCGVSLRAQGQSIVVFLS